MQLQIFILMGIVIFEAVMLGIVYRENSKMWSVIVAILDELNIESWDNGVILYKKEENNGVSK